MGKPNIFNLAQAAVGSAAAAGLVILLLIYASVAGESPAAALHLLVEAAPVLFLGALIAMGQAVLVAGLPALILGRLLWKAELTQPSAPWPLVWAAAGMMVGAGSYAITFFYILPGPGGRSDSDAPFLVAAFIATGAAAALIFRAVMLVLEPPSPDEGERP